MNSHTVKCPICGEPYTIMPYYAGDQSACTNCVDRARANLVDRYTNPNRKWKILR